MRGRNEGINLWNFFLFYSIRLLFLLECPSSEWAIRPSFMLSVLCSVKRDVILDVILDQIDSYFIIEFLVQIKRAFDANQTISEDFNEFWKERRMAYANNKRHLTLRQLNINVDGHNIRSILSSQMTKDYDHYDKMHGRYVCLVWYGSSFRKNWLWFMVQIEIVLIYAVRCVRETIQFSTSISLRQVERVKWTQGRCVLMSTEDFRLDLKRKWVTSHYRVPAWIVIIN